MNWKFAPEDFLRLYERRPINEFASELANAKLQEWLKKAKVVYSKGEPDWRWYTTPNNVTEYSDTHKALLINIEPIVPPQVCKHEASKVNLKNHYVTHGLALGEKTDDYIGFEYTCSCGARVTPSGFEAVK